MSIKPYQYQAKVTRVIDGDTLEVVVDLGFHASFSTTLRLYGINAPEMKGTTKAAGTKSKERLKTLLEGKDVLIDSKRLDKYGRTVSTVFVGDMNVNELMVKEGLAVRYMEDS